MNRRDGFTYAEFTVAMAIICILAAILFPVFAKAKEKARSTECLNHLLNIGAGLRMYAADWHGHFLPADNDLTPLVPNYLPDAAALTCPTAHITRSSAPPPGRPHYEPALSCDYVYRGGLCDDDLPNIMVAADDVGDRHNGGGNCLFVDGHARWIHLPYDDRDSRELRDKYRGIDEIQALRSESVPPPPWEQLPDGSWPPIPGGMPVPPGGPGPPPLPGRPGP